MTPRSALPLRHRDLECHEAPPHRTPSALLAVAVLLASCGGAQVAPSPRPPFPSEALGFRFGASYEEARLACPGDWRTPGWRHEHRGSEREAFCAMPGREVSVTFEGEPLRVVSVRERGPADSMAEARRAADEASSEVEARYGPPTTAHERGRDWNLAGGSIYVGYSGPSNCSVGPAYSAGITYAVSD